MKSFRVWYEDKRYRVDLDDTTGEPIGYAVEVSARGKGPTERRLWSGREGHDGMPQRLKNILNARGVSETIAYDMDWSSISKEAS